MKLVRREQADVGESRTVAWIYDATDFGLKSCPDGVQQCGEGGVIGGLRNSRTGPPNVAKFAEVLFQRDACHIVGGVYISPLGIAIHSARCAFSAASAWSFYILRRQRDRRH